MNNLRSAERHCTEVRYYDAVQIGVGETVSSKFGERGLELSIAPRKRLAWLRKDYGIGAGNTSANRIHNLNTLRTPARIRVSADTAEISGQDSRSDNTKNGKRDKNLNNGEALGPFPEEAYIHDPALTSPIREICKMVVLPFPVTVKVLGKFTIEFVSTFPGGVNLRGVLTGQLVETPLGSTKRFSSPFVSVLRRMNVLPVLVSSTTTPRAAAAVAPCHTVCWIDCIAA